MEDCQFQELIHSVQRILALITLNCNQPVNTGRRANTGRCVIFTWLKPYLNAHALIFSVCEGSSQPIANQLNMQKNMVSIFLTISATIFDTYGSTSRTSTGAKDNFD